MYIYVYICVRENCRGGGVQSFETRPTNERTTKETKLVLSWFATPPVPEIERLLGLLLAFRFFNSQLNSLHPFTIISLLARISCSMIRKIVQNECKLKKTIHRPNYFLFYHCFLLPCLILTASLLVLGELLLLLRPTPSTNFKNHHAPFLPLGRLFHPLHCCHGIPYDFLPTGSRRTGRASVVGE